MIIFCFWIINGFTRKFIDAHVSSLYRKAIPQSTLPTDRDFTNPNTQIRGRYYDAGITILTRWFQTQPRRRVPEDLACCFETKDDERDHKRRRNITLGSKVNICRSRINGCIVTRCFSRLSCELSIISSTSDSRWRPEYQQNMTVIPGIFYCRKK